MTTFATIMYVFYIFAFVLVLAKMGITLVGPYSKVLQEAAAISRSISWEIMVDKFHSNPFSTLAMMASAVTSGVVFTYLAYLLFNNYLPNEFTGWVSFDRKPVWMAAFWGGIALIYSQAIGNFIRGYFEYKHSPKLVN